MEIDKEKILQAGKIASQVREYARKFIKKGMPLKEIADRMEEKMAELGGKPAFATCLSIDDAAAHYIPYHDDKTIADGILKVDFGVHVDGWIADTAFSIDLEDSDKNRKIIKSSEEALENAIKKIKKGVKISEIGEAIESTISAYGLNPITNLFGHSVEQYELHAGISIPNFDNKNNSQIQEGLYAIEPFATNGNGSVGNGKPSATYLLVDDKNVRSNTARQVLRFIIDEYKTLPFCSRWLVKKFGTNALIALKHLEENGNVRNYPVLMEISGGKVSQTEHTILVEDDKITVTTL